MFQPGEIVDRYVVEDVVARGGTAIVYAARHQTLGTRHALDREIGNLRGQSMMLGNLGELAVHAGDLDAAEQDLADGLALAETIGNSAEAVAILTRQSELEQRRGRFTHALARAEAAVAAARRSTPRSLGDALRQLGELRVETGDVAGALAALDEARDVLASAHSRLLEAQTACARARVTRDPADVAAAVAAVDALALPADAPLARAARDLRR